MHQNERLVEQYIRLVKNWFTISNIGFGINREIDILAVDSKGKAYHIEVDIHKGGLQWGSEGKDWYSVKEYKQRKFDKEAKLFIKNKYGITKTQDIWVCWGIHPKVKELISAIGTSQYGDDIIQSLSIVKAALKL